MIQNSALLVQHHEKQTLVVVVVVAAAVVVGDFATGTDAVSFVMTDATQ